MTMYNPKSVVVYGRVAKYRYNVTEHILGSVHYMTGIEV